jgi:hypothetical protein
MSFEEAGNYVEGPGHGAFILLCIPGFDTNFRA